ncbi:MAG: exonuclease SbcCD subunit D [Motiliproteus sp.]
MRVLHTSDWHIGRQFHNVSLLDDQRHVLEQIVALVADKQVEVVLIAGDIYDRSVPPAAAVELLDQILNRICCDLRVPVILIPGNHDSAERLNFGSRHLKGGGLHIIGQLQKMLDPVVLESVNQDSPHQVAFYGIPYADPALVRDRLEVEVSSHDQAMALLCERIKQQHQQSPFSQLPAVVLSHCFIDGGEGCESERPLSIGGADRVSADHFGAFAYSALGHLHGPQYKGRETTRYSGSILKYSFSEQHQQKSVTLVDINAAGETHIEKLPLQPLRDMRILEGELQQLLQAGIDDPAREDYLLIRLTDKHAILDVMGKLREVYPNVLHLERPGLQAQGEVRMQGREQLKKGELSMFSDFFQQVTGDILDAEQNAVVEKILENLHRADVGNDGGAS